MALDLPGNLMENRTCLVTGATSGLGRATAIQLARFGATVLAVGRNPVKIDQLCQDLQDLGIANQVRTYQADLSDTSAIKHLAAQVNEEVDCLDVLFNNAGGAFLRYGASPDGVEQTWAVNVLCPYLLTQLLATPLLRAADQLGQARVINLTSLTFPFGYPPFDRPMGPFLFNGVLAYARSKRAVIHMSEALRAWFNDQRIHVYTLDPGLVRTNVARNNGWLIRGVMRLLERFSLPVDEGILPILRLASAEPALPAVGLIFRRFTAKPLSAALSDPAIAKGMGSRIEQISRRKRINEKSPNWE